MDVSRRRLQVRSLHRRIGTLLERFLARSPLFAGSLYEQKVQCGKPRCKCATGRYRHRMWCVSFVQDGRSRTRVVPASTRVEVKRMTEQYRRLREDRRQMRTLFDDLLAACDALAEARADQGRQRYARLVAQAKADKEG